MDVSQRRDRRIRTVCEFTGEVVKVGPGVQRLKVGDRVSAIPDGLNFGGFAQYRVTKEKECQLLAPGIDPVYALGEPQKCVMTVLRATAAEPGDFGVVLGVGPMGMWCVQALAGKSPSSTTDRRAFCVRPKCSGGGGAQSKKPHAGAFLTSCESRFLLPGSGLCRIIALGQDRTIRLRHLPEKSRSDFVTFSCNTQRSKLKMHSVCCAKQSIALLKAGITRILRGAMRHVCGPSGHKQQKTLLFFAEEEYQNLIFLEICSCRIMRCCPRKRGEQIWSRSDILHGRMRSFCRKACFRG